MRTQRILIGITEYLLIISALLAKASLLPFKYASQIFKFYMKFYSYLFRIWCIFMSDSVYKNQWNWLSIVAAKYLLLIRQIFIQAFEKTLNAINYNFCGKYCERWAQSWVEWDAFIWLTICNTCFPFYLIKDILFQWINDCMPAVNFLWATISALICSTTLNVL